MYPLGGKLYIVIIKCFKIVLENFEGERFFQDDIENQKMEGVGITLTGDEIGQNELWCDELDGGEHNSLLCFTWRS